MKHFALIRGNRGNAVLEMALIMPLLLFLCFGITEFGRAWTTVSVITSAAREGARLAVVTAPDIPAVEARVREVCDAAGVDPSAIVVTPPDPNDAQRRVTVRVETQFEFIPVRMLNFFQAGRFNQFITLSRETVMRHEGL